MRLWISLALLALTPVVARAAEPFEVPKTWQKIDTKLPVPELTGRDGYVVWVESKVVPGTENFRAWLYTEKVYRLKAGDKVPELLTQGQSSGHLQALLGPNGAVAVGYFAQTREVHLPGHKPLVLPADQYYGAHAFTADGLLCGVTWASAKEYQNAVVFFPIDYAKGTLGEMRLLRWWPRTNPPDGYVPDLSHGCVFLRGDLVLTTGNVPDPMKQRFSIESTELWSVKTEKVVWRQRGTLEAADDTHAYWFPTPNVIARRALNADAKPEQLTLAKEMIRIDVQPPSVLAIVKHENAWVLTRFDLKNGRHAEYDLRITDVREQLVSVSGGGPPHRRVMVRVDGRLLQFSFDGATGEVRTVWDGTLYRVPVAKPIPADGKPKWEPLEGGK